MQLCHICRKCRLLVQFISRLRAVLQRCLSVKGNQVASIIGVPMNALLCASSFLDGWPAIFYVNGALYKISLNEYCRSL